MYNMPEQACQEKNTKFLTFPHKLRHLSSPVEDGGLHHYTLKENFPTSGSISIAQNGQFL